MRFAPKGRVLWLGLLGLVAYLVFLIVSLPAAQAWKLIDGQVPVKAFGLNGTVWEGSAAVVLQAARRIEALQWDLRPSRLLLGRLDANIQARLPGGRIRSDVSLSPGSVAARQVRFEMPAPELVQWAGFRQQLPVRLEGQFDAVLRELLVDGKQIEKVDGLVGWNNAVIRFGSAPLPLGDLALRLEPATGGTNGTLTSQGGTIDVGGTMRLSPDGRFVMDLAVKAQGEISEDTRRAMALLRIPADGSQIRARLSGSLDGTGLRLERVKG